VLISKGTQFLIFFHILLLNKGTPFSIQFERQKLNNKYPFLGVLAAFTQLGSAKLLSGHSSKLT